MPVAGRPLILATLAAWRQSRVEGIVVVVRSDDLPLADVVRATGVDVVIPAAAPPDMKASIGCGLEYFARTLHPEPTDCWLVAPADMPRLSPAIIDRLLNRAASLPKQVLIPTLTGRRGHPVLLPWKLASEVSRLPENEGLNALIDRNGPELIACDDLVPPSSQAFADIDTPEDWRSLGE
jgi:molybdenum cofactor cytidylyltransferase